MINPKQAEELEELISDLLWVRLRHLFRHREDGKSSEKLAEVASEIMQHVRPIIDQRDYLEASQSVFRVFERAFVALADNPQALSATPRHHQMDLGTKRQTQTNEEEKPEEFPRPGSHDRTIDGLDFVDTCTSFPEQYDAFRGDEKVGYVRLRGGQFRVDCPGCGHETVYKREPMAHYGEFNTEPAREFWLNVAAKRINRWLASCQTRKQEPQYRPLEAGERIQEGDEYDDCPNSWKDNPRWVPARNIGQLAPDPMFPSHRQYRRRIEGPNK